MRRPKYLNVLTDSRAEPLSIMGVLGDNGDLFRETCITLHLDSLKVMKLEVAQVWIIFMRIRRSPTNASCTNLYYNHWSTFDTTDYYF